MSDELGKRGSMVNTKQNILLDLNVGCTYTAANAVSSAKGNILYTLILFALVAVSGVMLLE